MKKWMYVIFPGVMLAVFFFFYFASQKEIAERERHKAEQIASQKAADDAHKADVERKAREDAAAHAAAQAAKEARVLAEKEAKWQSDTNRIQADTDQSNLDFDKFSKLVTQQQAELENLHKDKDRTTRESFDAAKAAELAAVQRRDSELDIQRMVTMIADRADKSSLTKMPPFVAAPPPTASN